MPKAIWIDSTRKEISYVTYETPDDMRDFIGGWLEIGAMLRDENVLYVDEEGLLKNPEHFFRFSLRPDQPLAGNGLIVGREVLDEEGELIRMDDVALTVEEVWSMTRFWP